MIPVSAPPSSRVQRRSRDHVHLAGALPAEDRPVHTDQLPQGRVTSRYLRPSTPAGSTASTSRDTSVPWAEVNSRTRTNRADQSIAEIRFAPRLKPGIPTQEQGWRAARVAGFLTQGAELSRENAASSRTWNSSVRPHDHQRCSYAAPEWLDGATHTRWHELATARRDLQRCRSASQLVEDLAHTLMPGPAVRPTFHAV